MPAGAAAGMELHMKINKDDALFEAVVFLICVAVGFVLARLG